MARKRKDGKRTDKQRLSRSVGALRERNPPSLKVVERQDRFRPFMGDKAIGHETTCAGRLMLVGCFDGMDQAPEIVLAALLEYQQLYWSNYPGAAASSDFSQRVKQSSDNEIEDVRGKRFDRMDGLLRDCGRSVRGAVVSVTAERHWFPDEDCGWAARVINTRVLQKRRDIAKSGKPVPSAMAVSGELASDDDWAMVALLRIGAAALCGTRNRRAA